MTNPNGLLARLKALPVLLPMVGVFQLIMLVMTLVTFAQLGELAAPEGLGSVGRWLIFAGCWAVICLTQRRWSVLLYMLLSGVELLWFYVGPADGFLHTVSSDALVLFNVLLCFFLLVYYKRFD